MIGCDCCILWLRCGLNDISRCFNACALLQSTIVELVNDTELNPPDPVATESGDLGLPSTSIEDKSSLNPQARKDPSCQRCCRWCHFFDHL